MLKKLIKKIKKSRKHYLTMQESDLPKLSVSNTAKRPSFQEAFQTIPIVGNWPWWRKMTAFAGPGYLIAVGYMDPGNWATCLAGGSSFGYSLLFIILLANCMAILLQSLAAKLGIVTGRDLAQACRDHFSPRATFFLWFICEIAICACDLAEVIGSAIALKLLFGLPLLTGVIVTAFDVLFLLYLQRFNVRMTELFVVALISLITLCFIIEMFFCRPDLGGIIRGFLPQPAHVFDPEILYLGIGIIGATVMPHNLYLHSSIVQSRYFAPTIEGKREAIWYSVLDLIIALTIAFFVNAAILILAAAVFHRSGQLVTDIEDAYQLLSPLLGTPLASFLFALALLASGQNSTLTGVLAGQIVMDGFLDIQVRPWLRRLITRSTAIIPAICCILIYGQESIAQLLLFSQVILSFQLAFAVVPLIMFTSDSQKMGPFANAAWLQFLAIICAALIIGFNLIYLYYAIYPLMA